MFAVHIIHVLVHEASISHLLLWKTFKSGGPLEKVGIQQLLEKKDLVLRNLHIVGKVVKAAIPDDE